MARFDITIAGEINMDLILEGLPVELPLERESLATEFATTLGGSSSIVAHNLAALGVSVGFVTMVGSDPLGTQALELLRASGVDLTKVLHGPQGVSTGVSVLLTHGRSRRILTYLGTMSALGVRDLDREYLRSGRHFHLSSLFLQKGLQPGLVELFAELKAAGLTLSLDTNDDPDDRWQSGLPELLGLVDVFLPNDDEACRMTQTASVEHAADALAAMVPLVAIKCGRRGALVRSGDESWMVPPFCVEPVDAIGAGDSFNAGFLKAYLQGQHPAACALEGNRVAALSTTERGGTTAFRDREQMTAALRAAKLRTQTVEAVETAS